MTDALFDFEREKQGGSQQLVDLPIRDDQIAAIRQAFDTAGIDDQSERRSIVQSVTMRQVDSLRQLHAREAHRVLQRLKQDLNAKPRLDGASAWDLREEDTWIDKL